MMRRSFVHLLLSLLLLASQQMAMSHVIAHLADSVDASAGSQQEQDEDDLDLASAVAKDQSCHQCAAFAQVAAALGNTPRHFAAPELVARAAPTATARADCTRTVLAFQSRAPPQA
jgi:hypothetical protein